MLEDVNSFIPIYRNAHEQMAAAGAAHASLTADLNLVMKPGADRRRETCPPPSRSTRKFVDHLPRLSIMLSGFHARMFNEIFEQNRQKRF